ncbi:hypothetical protein CASFOL_038029 [Castilleja foliolosa]|uniref:Protein kinase domain-containing protein n=1 Tax=Castilleja foliolosa TaxID=1961234 RepID=A0ABD3BJU3_9LAMI
MASTQTLPLILYAIATVTCLLFLSAVFYLLYDLWYSKLHKPRTIPFDTESPLNELQKFSFKDLKRATNNFSASNSIGKGGSGVVFRGILTDGKFVAVKLFDSNLLQSEQGFHNELKTLGGIKHCPLIVSLIGFCVEKDNRLLVFEYMPNRSLQHYLFFDRSNNNDVNLCLNWGIRFNIILDVAKALAFLHLQCEPALIHGDVKPSNVLLDSEFRAKLSDFGLSRCKPETPLESPENDEVDLAVSSKDYVTEWIGSRISPNSEIPVRDDEIRTTQEKKSSYNVENLKKHEGNLALELGFEFNGGVVKKIRSKKRKKMHEWWKEENLNEISNNAKRVRAWNKNVPHFGLGKCFGFRRIRGKPRQEGEKGGDQNRNTECSFGLEWLKKQKQHFCSMRSKMWSGDLFHRELSSTMRGTLGYASPEYNGYSYLNEKADIYSLGVLILVIVSGRRPLHVLASPMKLEKANLISWAKSLSYSGNILDLVDERLNDEFNKEQASLCINLALACLQKMPESRPDIGDIVKVLKGKMELPKLPFEFSASPPSVFLSRSRRK